jgi:hypothetical protein
MRKDDLSRLGDRLGELADYYGLKAPTPKALLVWGDALESIQWADVAPVLTDWPKTHSKFPTADAILKIARDRVSDRIEEEARRNRDTAPRLDDLRKVDTPAAEAFFRAYDAIFRRKVVHDPRAWCRNVLKAGNSPEHFRKLAEESLEQMQPEDTFRYETKRDGKDWARRIVGCFEAGEIWPGSITKEKPRGEKVHLTQITLARTALGVTHEKS